MVIHKSVSLRFDHCRRAAPRRVLQHNPSRTSNRAGDRRLADVKTITPAKRTSGSDGNFTVEMGIPTLDGLGVDGDGAHTNHEHLLFSSIEPRTRLLQGLMERLE